MSRDSVLGLREVYSSALKSISMDVLICKLVLLFLLSNWSILLTAQATVISYNQAPELHDGFFQAALESDTSSRFAPQLQWMQTSTQPGVSNSMGVLGWEARAITFPRTNSLSTGEDRDAALAYYQAMWHIAGYHAALLKSRLRRDAAKSRRLVPGTTLEEQAIQSSVESEWNLTLEALAKETGFGSDPVRVMAFSEQYKAAVDTITWPLVENRPHGMEMHFGFGVALPTGFGESLNTGFGMDIGIGYTYDRWLALLMVGVNRTPVEQPNDASKPILNEATQWNNVGLDLGYRWLRNSLWESTIQVRLGDAGLKTGGGDEQTDLRNDFMTGVAATVSRSVFKPILGETRTGRKSGFAVQAMVSYTPQRWLNELNGGVLYLGVGMQMTFYGSGYER